MGCSGFIVRYWLSVSATPSNYTSMAIIKLHTEGFATVYTGASDIGQGSDTVLSMIAAEELGIALNKVRIVAADTELTPFDRWSYGSRGNIPNRKCSEKSRCRCKGATCRSGSRKTTKQIQKIWKVREAEYIQWIIPI